MNVFHGKQDDIDFLLMDQMDDVDLTRYCQTDKRSKLFCSRPQYQKRIQHYKNYLIFDPIDYILTNDFYPIFVFRLAIIETYFAITYDVFDIQADQYYWLNYHGVINDNDNIGGVNSNNIIEMTEHQNRRELTVKRIDKTFEKIGNVSWEMDLRSLYNLYSHVGFKQYAKEATLKYLDKQYNKMKNDNAIEVNNMMKYFKLIPLLLWFQINCIAVGLDVDRPEIINEEIDDMNSENLEKLIDVYNQINLYYDMLKLHLETYLN